jgi:hypothetical protein
LEGSSGGGGVSAIRPNRRNTYETPNMMRSGTRQRRIKNIKIKIGLAAVLSMSIPFTAIQQFIG